MKQELGLNHYEGRSWSGLHHHCLLTMISFAFLQHLRLKGKKNFPGAIRLHTPRCRRSGAD
jgi:SRSO17 transposase